MRVVISLFAVFGLILAATPIFADEAIVDSAGRVTKVIHVDGSETRMTYDVEGRLILVEKPDGSRVCTSYDEGGGDTFDC